MPKSAEISSQADLFEATQPESRWPIIGLTPEGKNKMRRRVRVVLPETVDENSKYPFLVIDFDTGREVQLHRKKDIRLAYQALGLKVPEELEAGLRTFERIRHRKTPPRQEQSLKTTS